MTRQSSGGAKPPKNSVKNSASPKKFALLDLQNLRFEIDGNETNIEDCTDEQFARFIRCYVQLTGDDLDRWPLEERRDVLNFAIEQGQSPNFLPNTSPNFLVPSESQGRSASKKIDFDPL